jgi:hypothetical protein
MDKRDELPVVVGERTYDADQLWPNHRGEARQRQADLSRSEMLLDRDRRARESELKRPPDET